MLKTSTVTKFHQAEKLLKTAHEVIVDAIVADPAFAAFAMANPKDSNVTLLITALLKVNAAGKQLEELLERHD